MALETPMTLEDELCEYVTHVCNGGDPYVPEHPLGKSDHQILVHWRTDEGGNTRLELCVDGERYGCFTDGSRIEPSWEGGVGGPDVDEWDGVCVL